MDLRHRRIFCGLQFEITQISLAPVALPPAALGGAQHPVRPTGGPAGVQGAAIEIQGLGLKVSVPSDWDPGLGA